jgi:8-hydroxy-5-deazaflavin:NADPH oxidoreductase
MSYAIVGFGKIGQALAHAFARKNINVTVASAGRLRRWRRRLGRLDPRSSPSRCGMHSRPTQSSWRSRSGSTRGCEGPAELEGKTVIDATNAFGVPPEELEGLLSSAFVAKAFTGAKLVKGFNHLGAAKLATDPVVEGGHRVVFLSSDDEDATAPVAALAKQLGFAPVKLGKLNEGGALVHARGRTWGQLIFQDLFKKQQ